MSASLVEKMQGEPVHPNTGFLSTVNVALVGAGSPTTATWWFRRSIRNENEPLVPPVELFRKTPIIEQSPSAVSWEVSHSVSQSSDRKRSVSLLAPIGRARIAEPRSILVILWPNGISVMSAVDIRIGTRFGYAMTYFRFSSRRI